MKNTIKNLLIFSTGASIGAFVTYKLINKKYKDLADSEISSVRSKFNSRLSSIIDDLSENEDIVSSTIDSSEEVNKDPEKTAYNKIVSMYNTDNKEENNESFVRTLPYLITPDEFGDNDQYGTKFLKYFTDDVLVDEIESVINIDDIGRDNLKLFGTYEEDVIHIRDVDNEMDYEVVKFDCEFTLSI